MAVPISTEGLFEAGNPVKLFTRRLNNSGYQQARYDVTNDGQRFLLNVSVDAPEEGSILVVQNWSEAQ